MWMDGWVDFFAFAFWMDGWNIRNFYCKILYTLGVPRLVIPVENRILDSYSKEEEVPCLPQWQERAALGEICANLPSIHLRLALILLLPSHGTATVRNLT